MSMTAQQPTISSATYNILLLLACIPQVRATNGGRVGFAVFYQLAAPKQWFY